MGGGGGSSTEYQAAAAPSVVRPTAGLAPVAPTAPGAAVRPDEILHGDAEAMPENVAQATFTSGVARTAEERLKSSTGSSRLVIPLAGNTQSGGYTAPTKPTGVV